MSFEFSSTLGPIYDPLYRVMDAYYTPRLDRESQIAKYQEIAIVAYKAANQIIETMPYDQALAAHTAYIQAHAATISQSIETIEDYGAAFIEIPRYLGHATFPYASLHDRVMHLGHAAGRAWAMVDYLKRRDDQVMECDEAPSEP